MCSRAKCLNDKILYCLGAGAAVVGVVFVKMISRDA